MKKLIILVSTLIVIIMGTPGFAQEKSETKSLLTEAYKELLIDALAILQLGNQDVDLYMSQQIDSLLRVCYMADAEAILAAQESAIADGKIKRPKLAHDKVDGKTVLKRSTIRAYEKGFAKFLISLPRNVKEQSYADFVKNNRRIVSRPKSKLMKEYKDHLKTLLRVKS
ncbi:MAG: hypothetical protein PHR61_00805 [Candidatus Absconditabacteria bacterium]|nr:hypothetical protein [Candidatus Absconditabacteria bacterium]